MEYLLIVVSLVTIFGGLFYVANNIYKRGKRRYWDMYNKIINIQGQVSQIQGQVGQIQGQVNRVKEHLFLDHMGDIARLARDADYMDNSSLKKILEFIHELEMDNLSGNDMQVSKEFIHEK